MLYTNHRPTYTKISLTQAAKKKLYCSCKQLPLLLEEVHVSVRSDQFVHYKHQFWPEFLSFLKNYTCLFIYLSVWAIL